MVDLDALEAELSANIGKDKTFDAMPIIRRAVSPSAPDGVRGDAWTRVRKIISRYEDGSTESMAIADGVASAAVDAVLAVLPPAPRVDVDAVLKLIDEFAAVSVRSIFHPEVTPQINEQFAAIWAMLEGTA